MGKELSGMKHKPKIVDCPWVRPSIEDFIFEKKIYFIFKEILILFKEIILKEWWGGILIPGSEDSAWGRWGVAVIIGKKSENRFLRVYLRKDRKLWLFLLLFVIMPGNHWTYLYVKNK